MRSPYEYDISLQEWYATRIFYSPNIVITGATEAVPVN